MEQFAALDLLLRAIESAGFTPGEDVSISLDIAASQFGSIASGGFAIANAAFIWDPLCGIFEVDFANPETGYPDMISMPDLSTFRPLTWREGAAIVLSSHLLHLLEEVCSHVLILKQGTKIADGTIAEVSAQFANGESNVSLEEIFMRATGGSET